MKSKNTIQSILRTMRPFGNLETQTGKATLSRRQLLLKRVGTWKHILVLCTLAALLQLTPPVEAQVMTAHVDQPIASPTFVNIYWDAFWDLDNPTMTKAKVDSITQAIIGSRYWAGLAEYGVMSASFAGGFLPDPHCALKAPNSVGFWDPFNPGIAGFIQCEHDNGPPIFRQNDVIYNIILPPSAIESDFWSANFCNGPGSPTAWHYHGLQNGFPAFGGQPIYTIVLANPLCLAGSSLFENLTHEMVEAATDPYPIDISIFPLHFGISTETEIADFCESQFVNFPDPNAPVRVSPYWSNSQQRCTSGLAAAAPPTGPEFAPNQSWTMQPYYGSLGTFFADVDGDGRADAIVVNTNTVTIRRSTGNAFGNYEDWTMGPYYGSRGTFFADVDGDGKADAIVVNDDTVTVRRAGAICFLCLDYRFNPNEDWTHGSYYGSTLTAFADVDGDGKADAIVINGSQVVVRRSNGNMFTGNEVWSWSFVPGTMGSFLFDVNSDGRADLIAVNQGSIMVSLSTVTGGFAPATNWLGSAWAPGSVPGLRSVQFAKFNWFGKSPAMVYVTNSGVYVFPAATATGTTRFMSAVNTASTPFTQFGSAVTFSSWPYYGDRGTFFADVTGDGSDDGIVVNSSNITVRPAAP